MTEFRKLIQGIIDDYCAEFGIEHEDLYDRIRRTGRRKLVKGVHTSAMRMCLGYFIDTTFTLKLTQIAQLVGYTDHSVLSGNRKRCRWYLDNNDTFFLMYYKPLLKVADKYEDMINCYRKCQTPIYEL